MQFNDVSEFFAMGGYGLYVWLSFGISAVAILLLLMATRLERLFLERKVIQEFNRRERIKAARLQDDKGRE